MRARLPSAAAACLACLAVSACELEEITIVEVQAVAVAEVYVSLGADPADTEVRAFLHRTVGADTVGLPPLTDSRVVVRRSDGSELELAENPFAECVGSTPPGDGGVCFLADPSQARALEPGELLEVAIELPGGGRLEGTTRIPSSFELVGVPSACRLDPDTPMPLRWTRSDGAWAYLNETLIRGLPEALEPEGIAVEDDPLYLLGLSISDQDTTIVFPSEFGVFNRFELEQDLALRLQRGLPGATTSTVTITATDRNFVNWARGGNFNPSGQVRVPSLSGDGTGVFASAVNRRFVVFVEEEGGPISACPTPSAP